MPLGMDGKRARLLNEAAGRELARDDKGAIVIEGDLILQGTPLTSLPDNLCVTGLLDLCGASITALPENLTVGGDLILACSAVTSLPQTLRVVRNLRCNHSAIAALPDNLAVGGSLDLNGTPIASLPENLTVSGDLLLSHTNVTSLPATLRVGGNLNLTGTPIASMPDNFTVGGWLSLTGTPITSLPKNLTVGSALYLQDTPITSLPENLTAGSIPLHDTAMASVPPGVVRGNMIQGETRTYLMGRSCAVRLAAAWDPVGRLKEILDGFDSQDGFALWVAEPALAAEQLRQAAPQWGAEEHARWDDLLHSLGAWKEAARPGGFPLGRDGAALGFEIEVRNQEAAEVRTPHTTSWERAGEYLEQVRGYFRRNAEYLPVGYYWNMHLNLSLTKQERANAEKHLGGIEQICHRLLIPNNPFGRNVHNEARSGRVFVQGVTRDPRCPMRKDAVRLEMKEAAVHADLDVGYLFVCLDVIRRLVQAPERLGPALSRLEGLYQQHGLPAKFKPLPSVRAEVVQALLFERAAADFRRSVKRSNGDLILKPNSERLSSGERTLMLYNRFRRALTVLLAVAAFYFLLPCPASAQPVRAPGSSAAPAVPRYARFEASWTLPNQTGNPFDPADNDVRVMFVGPGASHVTTPAFWDGDRWRVRFAPTRVGAYSLSVRRNGQPVAPADLRPARFRCVPSASFGFIRRDPKVVQRFVFDNGRTFYPLGMDAAWTNRQMPDYPPTFARMHRAGMNWVRIWMNY